MKLKTKIEDWYDNLYFNISHIGNNIQNFFHFIKRWLSYYKVLKTAHDFDWESIIEVERHQLIRVKNSISKYHNHVDWKHDVWWMNIAIKLLDIIQEDGCSKLIGVGFKTEPCENGLYELVEDPDSKWIMPIYVNTANSHRFLFTKNKCEFEDPKIGPLLKDQLRVEKAWQLYHKVRTYKLRSWWD